MHKPRVKEVPPMVAKAGGQLMEFLLTSLPGKNRNNIKTLLNHRQILVNGQVVGFYNHQLQPGDTVQILKYKAPAEMTFSGMTIVFEDEHIIVVDKHAGMLCSSATKDPNTVAATLLRYVRRQSPVNSVYMASSLDRETSGLVVFAKTRLAKERLQQSLSMTDYTYLAIVEGVLEKENGVLKSYLWLDKKTQKMCSSQNPDQGQLAVTHVNLMKSNNHFSMLRVKVETNCKHQIRVQLHDIGHTIVGDLRYDAAHNPLSRLGLHAWALTFRHPATGKVLQFESHTPKRFLNLFGGEEENREQTAN